MSTNLNYSSLFVLTNLSISHIIKLNQSSDYRNKYDIERGFQMLQLLKKNKNLSIISLGQLISLLGNSIQRYALSLYVLDVTGSAGIFSIILTLTIIPQILFTPFGGAIADRVSKKKIMVSLDFFSSAILFLFLIVMHSASSHIIFVGILVFILAVIQSIYDPSVRASIPAVVESDHLMNANALISQISQISGLVGPIAAGFLYGFFGIEAILIMNLISFFVSALMELLLQIPFTKRPGSNHLVKEYTSDIMESIHYLYYEKRSILFMLLISASFNLFLTPLYTIGLPYVEKILFHVSNQLYGISEACIGIGILTGSMIVTLVTKRFPLEKFHNYFYYLAGVVALMGSATLLMVGSHQTQYLPFVLFTFIGFLFAIGVSVINILGITYMQQETPQDKMGRVMALVTSFSSALLPLGQILFGGFYNGLHQFVFPIYAVCAAICILLSIVVKRLLTRNVITF